MTAGVLDAVMDLQLNGRFKGLYIICQIEVEPGGMTQVKHLIVGLTAILFSSKLRQEAVSCSAERVKPLVKTSEQK